jgi:hypothetical protein
MGQGERLLRSNLLVEIFPRLASGSHRVTSPVSKRYNCIAWAAGDDSKWWWPGPNPEEEYWPASTPRVESLDAFQAAFELMGFVPCDNGNLEGGFEKIAIFASQTGDPTHASLQAAAGRAKLANWKTSNTTCKI